MVAGGFLEEGQVPMSESNTVQNQADSRTYWIHALTPLHVGAGRGIGFVDLPIVREVVTKFPYVPGSAVKGVLADHHGVTADTRKKKDSLHCQAFGRADEEGEAANSGSLVFTDAHLVCLPVRSLYGTFAWCTCPVVLARLKRDLRHARQDVAKLPEFTVPPTEGDAPLQLLVPATEGELRSVLLDETDAAYFEDLDISAQPSSEAAAWANRIASWVFGDDQAWMTIFQQRFAVVADDIFAFLTETATQVDARVRIDDQTKTVADGQLWYEESLPAESILAGIAWCGPTFGAGKRNDAAKRQEMMSSFCTQLAHIQLGGKATVGRGQVKMAFVKS